MNIPTLQASDFTAVLPAAWLALTASVLLLTEAFLTTPSRTWQALITTIGATLAGVLAFWNAFEPPRLVLQGYIVLDPFSSFLTAMVCLAVGLCALVAAGFLKHRNAERGEFYALMLFAGAGMSLLAASNEFITLFINLEILSISTYALTAFLRRGNRPSEAGFKYFILGAFSSALLLYGASLLYGATGATRFSDLAQALPLIPESSRPLALAGFGLVLAGFAFKVAAVPFHMWTPDVYEGAPTPATAMMSAGVKAAAFVAMVRVFVALSQGVDPAIPYALFSALALLTMVGGNLMALPQRNVKRMLAYSSIAHAGYLLLGVAALFAPTGVAPGGPVGLMVASPLLVAQGGRGEAVLSALLFYLLGYTVTTVGSFGLLAAVERREDETRSNTWDLERLAGLSQRRPAWALAMAIFMLSLGGIPPTVGFLGKLLIFQAAVDAGLLGLAIVGVLTSAAGVYYYLRVVVYMYMRPAAPDATHPEPSWLADTALALSAVGVIVLGLAPGVVTGWLASGALLLGG